MPLRALATHTAVITMIGLGLAAPASAAQGDGPSDKANATATSATVDASEKKSERSQTRSEQSTKSSTKASGGSSASTETKSSGSTKSSKSDTTTGPDHSTGNAGTSGDYDSPQPESKADQNDGGANGQCPEGPYCSDRTGKASMNGKGDGEAKGKPCAGCVGKADNKNPKGQMPNGTDHNKGYECDENQGIGQTNPAHTGCVTTTTTVTPPPTVIPPGIGGVDTEVPPAVTPPVVKGVDTLKPPAGVELFRPPAQAPEAAPAQVLPGAAALPATGATPAMTALSALAFGMLALGSGLLLYRRVTA